MRDIVTTALFSEANAIAEAIFELQLEFQAVAEDLVALGYDDMPRRTYFDSGNFNIDSEFLDEVEATGPTAAPSNPGPVREQSTRAAVSAKKRAEIGRSHNWTCLYCCEPGSEQYGPDGRRWHIDHKYAVARGGDNLDDNLALACATCNLEKKALLMAEFLQLRKKPKAMAEVEKLIEAEMTSSSCPA